MLTRKIMVVVALEALVAVGMADAPAGKASPPKEPNWDGGKLVLEPLGRFPSALDEFAKVWREESLPLLGRFRYRDANAVITAYIGRPPKNTRCLVAALLAQYGIRREMRDVPGAMTSLRRARKMAEAKLGKNHYDTSLVYVNLADFYEMRQQWKELSELYSFMIPLFIKADTPMERMVRMQYKYGNALLRSGQNAKAAKAFATGAQWARKVTMWRMDDWEGLHYAGQAVALTNLKKYGEAAEAVKAGAKVCDLDDPNNYMRPESELLMARGYLRMAQGKDGLKDYKQAYDAFGKYFDSQLYVKYSTGFTYAKKYEEALAIMREWYDRSKKRRFLHIVQKARPWSLVEPLSMYAELLKKTGKRRPEVTRLAKELCKTWLVQKRTTTQPSGASEASKRK